MSTLNDNDLFLVERSGTSHSVTTENLMSTIQDDDLMLVERNGVSYKVTGEDVKDQLGGPSGAIESPVAIISPEDGAGMSNVSVTPAAEGITGVVEGTTTESFNYSDNTTYVNGSPYDDTKTPQYGWDGDTSSQMIIQPQVNTDPVSVTTTGLSITGKLEVFTNGNQIVPTMKFVVTYDDGTSQETSSYNQNSVYLVINSGNEAKTVTSITHKHQGSGNNTSVGWRSVRANNVLLKDSDTVTFTTASLTYTTDKSLSLLADGQSMTQQPAYTPVTDTIKTVGSVSSWNQDQNWSSYGNNATTDLNWAYAFNGIYDVSTTNGVAPQQSSTTVWEGGTIPAAGKEVKIAIYNENGDVSGNSIIFNDSVTYNATKAERSIVSLGIFNSDISKISVSRVNSGVDTTTFLNGIFIDGKLLVDTSIDSSGAGTYSELEFNSPKDIVNFRPGDVVQADWHR